MGRYRILVTQTFEYDAVEAETGEEALFAVKETVHALPDTSQTIGRLTYRGILPRSLW